MDLLSIMRKSKENNNITTTEIDSFIQETNQLFTQIKDTSEMRLDAQTHAESAKITETFFEQQKMGEKMTTKKFIEIVKEGKAEYFFEKVMASCLRVTFADALRFSNPTRNVRKNVEKDEVNAMVEPLLLSAATDEDSTLTIIRRIKQIVKDEDVDFFRLVLDPNSYAKTIENIFYLSFAVKIKQVKLLDKNGLFVAFCDGDEEEDLNHMVISLEFHEYKKLIEFYGIKKPLLL